MSHKQTPGALRVIAAVQVRLGSSRLPRKALASVSGCTVLEWIVRRLQKCNRIDEVVIATTELMEDNAIADLAGHCGVLCARGSRSDLIQRLLLTARTVNADALVRITADCPLVDPGIVDYLVDVYRRGAGRVDAVTNVFPWTYPDGLDAEVLAKATLERLDREVKEERYREVLTSYVYDHAEQFRIINVPSNVIFSLPPGEVLPRLRWTLDYAEDLEFVRRIYAAFPGQEENFRTAQVLDLLRSQPDIAEINRCRDPNALLANPRAQSKGENP